MDLLILNLLSESIFNFGKCVNNMFKSSPSKTFVVPSLVLLQYYERGKTVE